jgi:hypothetical protein
MKKPGCLPRRDESTLHGDFRMKHAKRFSLFFFLGLLPLSTWACSCARISVQQLYDTATVIALVNVHGNIKGSPFEVLRSWKTKLPRQINVPDRTDGICGYSVGVDGIYLLYLDRNERGEFWTTMCSGNLHESDPKFRARIDWLDDFGIVVEND